MTTTQAPETLTTKHPVRGAVWGLFMGIGLALILFGRGIIAFGETSSFVFVIAIGVVIGVLWGMFGPAKEPKGARPVEVIPPAEPEPAAAPGPDASTDAEGTSTDGDDAGSYFGSEDD